MNTKSRFNIDTAFVSRETPGLAECIVRLNRDESLSSKRRRDLISGLTRISEALGRTPGNVPADPAWLQPRLAAISAVGIGIQPKTWSNILSNAKAGLDQCSITAKRTRKLTDLTRRWRTLWEPCSRARTMRSPHGLGRFVRFLDINDVEPHDVEIVHIDRYHEALVLNALRKDPEESAIQAIYAWNRAARLLPDWPKRRIEAPKRTRNYVLPETAVPETLVAEISALMVRLAHPDPLDPDSYNRALRPDTLVARRGQLLRFSSAVIHSGNSASDLIGLRYLVTPTDIEQGLRWILARQGNQPSPGVSNMCLCLRMVSRHDVKLGSEDQRRVEQIFRKLYTLPERLWKRVEASPSSHKSALLAEEAVALEILLFCPIRRKKLSELHLERDFQNLGNSRVLLQLLESRSKNGIAPCFDLPDHLVQRIDRLVRLRAGLLCPVGTPFLFPKLDGSKPMIGGQLGARVSKRVFKETGLEVNLHLMRHLAAKVVLSENPGHYELVRRILAHSETQLPTPVTLASKQGMQRSSWQKSSPAAGERKNETDWNALRRLA
jgi:hypothetical protein